MYHGCWDVGTLQKSAEKNIGAKKTYHSGFEHRRSETDCTLKSVDFHESIEPRRNYLQEKLESMIASSIVTSEVFALGTDCGAVEILW